MNVTRSISVMRSSAVVDVRHALGHHGGQPIGDPAVEAGLRDHDRATAVRGLLKLVEQEPHVVWLDGVVDVMAAGRRGGGRDGRAGQREGTCAMDQHGRVLRELAQRGRVAERGNVGRDVRRRGEAACHRPQRVGVAASHDDVLASRDKLGGHQAPGIAVGAVDRDPGGGHSSHPSGPSSLACSQVQTRHGHGSHRHSARFRPFFSARSNADLPWPVTMCHDVPCPDPARPVPGSTDP